MKREQVFDAGAVAVEALTAVEPVRFGYPKTRFRGLRKNRAQRFTPFALGNLFLVRRRLLA